MLGKIVELSGIKSQDGFEVIDGLEMYEDGRIDFSFGSIVSAEVHKKGTRITYIYSYCLRKEQDLKKEYVVSTDSDPNEKPSSELEEDFLWVFIPYSSGIETKAKKVAGIYSTEAILEMKVGETVTVKKADAFETYLVVKAGNELFLVKKTR